MRAERPSWLRGLALALLAIWVHAPSLWNGYVSDDEVYIRGIRELSSWAGLGEIWTRLGAVPQYYPLVHTVLWLEYRIWGLAPAGYHAMNLLTHAAVVLLAWRLLVRLAVPGAWLAAALFAVHPVQVETVAWASERKNLLSAAFALASMLAYLRFSPLDGAPRAARPRLAYALALVAYAAALLCKTVTVTTPAVLLVLGWWKRGTIARREVLALLPFFALGVPLSLVTVWVEREVVGASGTPWELGAASRVLIAGRAVWFYLAKLAWPHPLGFVYPRWDVDPSALWQWLFPLAGVALAAALFAWRGRIGRAPLAALLLFAGVLFPALGFFDVYPFLFAFVADHYQYHASLAPIALAAAGFAALRARAGPRARRAADGIALAVVALLGLLAHRETYAYRDDATLVRRSVELQPASWAARYRLGMLLQTEDRHEEAIAELREAARLFPAHAALHANVAVNLAALGRLDEAAASYERALAGDLDPDDRVATHLALGNLRVAQQRFAAAAEEFRAAASLAPRNGEAHYSLGLVLRRLGERDAALAALERSVALEPAAAKGQLALGTLLLERGDAARAADAFRRVLALEPGHAAATAALERALGGAGDQRGER